MVRSPFPFVAGAAPLDFLNTEIMLEGKPADLLRDGEDLLRWLARSGLATPIDIRAMRAAGRGTLESWLAECLRLRAAMRALFSRVVEGQPPRMADLRPIDDALSIVEGRMQLRKGEPRPLLEFLPRAVEPPFLIALATAEFLVSADLSLVRCCEGEGCILFFYDTTKSHTRRWCSMATCGNRTKVRAHYERKRSGE